MADEEKVERDRIRTGCDLLDILLGGEKNVFGLKSGSIVNVRGDSGSGKSFLKNEILAANYYRYKDRFKWIGDDTERGDTFDTKGLYGVELSSKGHTIKGKLKSEKGALKDVSIEFDHSSTVQEMDAHLTLFLSSLKDNDIAVYALDSLDGISDAGAEEDEMNRAQLLAANKDVRDAGSYNMGKQKFLSGFFANKAGQLDDKNCTLIMTSQYRDAIGSRIPGQKTVSGGRALKYYCNCIIDLTTIAPIEAKGEVIGSYVRVRNKMKARCSRPDREIYYSVYFSKGIDNVGSNIDYLFGLRDDRGKLISDTVCWGGQMPTRELLTQWLTDTNLREQYNAFAKQKIGAGRIDIDCVYEWAHSFPEVTPLYDSMFGKKMTRDELRALCETNKEDRKKLRQMVIDKWEAKEDAVAAAVKFNKVFDVDD